MNVALPTLLALPSPERARPSVGVAPARPELVQDGFWKRLTAWTRPTLVHARQRAWAAHRVQRMYETRAAHLIVGRDDLSAHGNPSPTEH